MLDVLIANEKGEKFQLENSKKSKFDIVTSGSGINRDKLTRSHSYVAILTNNFVNDEKCVGELRDAIAMKLPMYAIIDYKAYIPKWILKASWKKKVFFSEDNFEKIAKEILDEIQILEATQNSK